MTKSEYRKRHLKIVDYIYREYISNFHFNKTHNGSLLVQLSPIDKHCFHLLIKTYAENGVDSINNIALKVVKNMYKTLFGEINELDY